jgi:hypothetical protein
MKLLFNNFFYDQDLSPFLYLFRLVFNEPIEIGNLEDSELLIESIFGNDTFLYKKKWLYSFCFIGESDRRVPIFTQNNIFKDYSCVLKGEINNNNIVNFPLFVFYNYCYKFVYEYKNKPLITTIPPKDVCVIISNADSEGRNIFLSHLEGRVNIDYAGNYKNNVQKIEASHCTKEFVDFVSQYKIIISMENSKNKDYITEKILHGFSANTIPVYWGSDNIASYFNEERFVNVKSFNTKDMVEAIEKIVFLINNPRTYLETVNKCIYKDDHVPLTITNISYHIQNLLQIKNTQVKRFITFGNELYYNSVRRICKEAQNLRVFNEIYGFSDKYLKNEKDFWLKHGNFIESNKRGYGYWVWKPYLILQMMNKLNDGDILLYLDSQCRIDLNQKQFLMEYLEIVKKNKILFTPWKDVPAYEYCFNKMDLVHKLDMQNHELLNTYQNQSCIILIYVCDEIKELFKSIYYYACEDYHNIDDTPSIIPNHKNYWEHRHDQSLFSLLTKKNNYSADITIEKCIYRRGS